MLQGTGRQRLGMSCIELAGFLVYSSRIETATVMHSNKEIRVGDGRVWIKFEGPVRSAQCLIH